MSNFNKNGWVYLAQICEERQLVIDAETGIFFFDECLDRRCISVCEVF